MSRDGERKYVKLAFYYYGSNNETKNLQLASALPLECNRSKWLAPKSSNLKLDIKKYDSSYYSTGQSEAVHTVFWCPYGTIIITNINFFDIQTRIILT